MPDGQTAERAIAADASPAKEKFGLSAFSWALYEGGRNPYIFVSGMLFMPYIATVLAPNPIEGQKLVASIGVGAGLAAAATAPLIGAAADRLGRRKPWLALATGLVIPIIAMLWFAAPDNRGLPLWAILTLTGSVTLLHALGDIFFGAMLPYAAGPRHRGHASGLALSLGGFFSLSVILLMLWAFILPGKVDSPLVPPAPLLGLDASAHEPERIFGPLMALLFLVCAIPLFLFAKDAPPLQTSVGRAFKEGMGVLVRFFRNARDNRDQMVFLGARTFAQDASNALILLTGVYAAGVMKWDAVHMLALGVIMAPAGMVGGGLGAWLCHTFGPRRAYQAVIAGSTVGLLIELGVRPDRIFYVFNVGADPIAGLPLFNTLPEITLILAITFVKAFQAAGWATSRTLLTELAPPGQIGAFYGLAIVAGTGTGWVAPLLVGLFTASFVSQQAGFIPVVAMMVVGFILLFFIKGGDKPAPA
jgi:UMF1 family MFS transporter